MRIHEGAKQQVQAADDLLVLQPWPGVYDQLSRNDFVAVAVVTGETLAINRPKNDRSIAAAADDET